MNNEQPIKVQEALSYLRLLGFKPEISTFLDDTRFFYYKIEFSTKSNACMIVLYGFAKEKFCTDLDISSQFDDIYALIKHNPALYI